VSAANGAPVRGVIEATLLTACGCIVIAAILSSIRMQASAPAGT
jgi:hypothetical protein